MSMTESEAIRWLKEMQSPMVSEAELYCAETCYGTGKMVYPEPEDYVFETAIRALEEIQQYRAIGTVSEFRELKEKATAKKPEEVLVAEIVALHNAECTDIECKGWNCDECFENRVREIVRGKEQ